MTRNPRVVSYDFTSSVGVVTGAGGDLGRAVALRLAAAGAGVVAIDRDEAALAALRTSASSHPGRVITRVADVRDAEGMDAAVAGAHELGDSGVDVFFNNAGIEGRVAPIEELGGDDLTGVLAVNVLGVLNGLRSVLPLMTAGAAIVNTASTAALAGAPGMGAYVSSKHAVLGLTRTAASELSERGIRINAICPGPVEGRMMCSLDRQRAAVLRRDTHEGRAYATVDEVVEVVMFLLGDGSGLLTGQAVTAVKS